MKVTVRGWRLLWKRSIVANSVSENEVWEAHRGPKVRRGQRKAYRSPTREPGQASRSRRGTMGPGGEAAWELQPAGVSEAPGGCNQREGLQGVERQKLSAS